MQLSTVNLPIESLKTFCQKWQIVEFSVFGSALREDFRPNSDLDVLVQFTPNAPWTIVDLITMQQDLEDLVKRDVDLIEKRVIETSDNWIRRNEILNTAQVIYSTTYEPA
ncbi:MAG: nucleotidyltransferase [Leptolyngbya sp. DLM2.Bin15]|nr:MAG: nucleotidyltransferase [Leptolyngbya sp. DLM2.Bin15]